MFPTPAIRRWSSTNALIGARRPRAIARRCSAVNSGVSGSIPIRAARYARAPRAEQQVTGPESAWVDVHQAMAAVELEPHPRVRRLAGGIEQQRARHPQVHEQVAVAGERPDQVLARRADPLDRRAASAASTGWRVRARPARIEDLDRPRSCGPPDGAPAGGGWSRPRAARASPSSYMNDSPGSAERVASGQPAQHAGADVGQRPVVAARAVTANRASSGACSRVWSVRGEVRSQP